MAVSSTFVAADGDGYELQMGRWSRRRAPLFVDLAGIDRAECVLDVGSGITHSTWVFGACRVVDGDEPPLAQFQIGQAEGLFRSGRAFLYESLGAAWDAAQRGQWLTWEQRGLVWLATTQAVDQAVQVVDLVFRAGGGSAVYATLPIERCLRDLHTLAQHHSVAAHNYEVAGQLFLGFDMAGSHWGRDYRGDAP
ncbi:MAG TPA: hypothetical protein VFH48_41630 [Chloroflexota bacterium]|nr:hypothetical protein [Chloroflexota bacterium]